RALQHPALHSFPTRRSSDLRDYWFLSDEEFDERLAEDGFLEHVTLPWGEGYRSGTLWSELERITGRGCGRVPLLEIETGGALARSEEHTSELQSRSDLVCRL